MREALKLIADIASGSTTANSLQNIAKIAQEALAQPEQEPVAWLVYAKGSRRYFTLTFDVEKVPEIYKGGEAVPLYTTPQQRKPLTDEQIFNVARDHYNPHQRHEISFARAIEAAHGITEE